MGQDAIVRRFGHAVRRSRGKAGLSQEALARRARVHSTYISLVERGLRDPKLSSVSKLAKGLGMTPAELIGLTERK